MGCDESNLRVLVDRCSELEASHASLRAQLNELAQPPEQTRRERTDDETTTSYSDGLTFPGNFKTDVPRSHVLMTLGHALYVSKASIGEIIYWNRAAEKLYGWKDYEVLGQCFWEILIEEVFAPFVNRIMEKLRFGQSWSGQFPFKKRSGEIFLALVTKSPLYEDGELVGIITVSSDAAVFNKVNSNRPVVPEFNKRIQWHSRPQIASVPQMASSISDLASKVLSRRRSDDTSREGEGSISGAQYANPDKLDTDMAKSRGEAKRSQKEEPAEPAIAQPAKFAAKLLAKLQKKTMSKKAEASDGNGNTMQNGLFGKANYEPFPPTASNETTSDNPNFGIRSSPFPGLHIVDEDAELGLENPKAREVEDAGEQQVGAKNSSSGGSPADSTDSRSSKGEAESNSIVDSDIRWEDLKLGEEIGQGSFAVVFHGLWNGSDVAIKVYFGKDYSERTLLDYKKEIGIMRRLRHPNVLLFMGACYSQERLAIVTEYLPRQDNRAHRPIKNNFGVRFRQKLMFQPGALPTKVVCLTEVVTVDDLRDDEEYQDILVDMKEEGENFGSLVKVVIPRPGPNGELAAGVGKVFLEYADIEGSSRARAGMNGRKFGGKEVVAVFYPENNFAEGDYDAGSLFRILHKSNQVLDLKRRLKMALDVARGMYYLHRRNPPIVHRDLKSSNLLVDKNWNVKVGDFGLSKLKHATFLTAKSGAGTPQWMAPEVLRNERSNEKSDIFSFAVILWELVTVSIPWANLNSLQVVGVVGFMDRRLDLPEGIDPRILSLITDCWQSKPELRPSFGDIIQRMTVLLQSPSAPAMSPVQKS